jgi:hypothetical protein
VALEGDGEVVPAILDGDGVHDGLQGITASPKVWLTILRTSCNSGEGRLELGVMAGVLWTCRRLARRGDLGSGGLTRGFRSMRRIWWQSVQSRGALVLDELIARVRVLRQRDLDADNLVVLVYNRGR